MTTTEADISIAYLKDNVHIMVIEYMKEYKT